MMKKVERLNDVSLAEVSGGIDSSDVRIYGGALSAISAPVTLGLAIADSVCRNKANKNRNNCDSEKAKKFEKASSVLSKLTVTAGAIGTVGFVACVGGQIWSHFEPVKN